MTTRCCNCYLLPLSAAILCMAALLSGCAKAATPIELSCAFPLDQKVANSCVVSEQTLWRGAHPGPVAAAALVDLGVKTVVSLELFQDDRTAFEAAVINSRDVREIQYFQIRDWEPLVFLAPTKVDDHVARFLAIARTQPKPLFVHCRSGQNRTASWWPPTEFSTARISNQPYWKWKNTAASGQSSMPTIFVRLRRSAGPLSKCASAT